MEENESEIEDLFYLAEKMDSKIRFNLLMQIGYGKNLQDISNKLFKLRNQIYALSKKHGASFERSELYPKGYNKEIESAKFYGCSALRTGMYLSSEGLIFPCNLASIPIGNIYENSVLEIWRNENAKKIREITSCNESSCNISCGGKCKAKEI